MTAFQKWVKRYNEWLSLPLAVVLFFAAPQLYRQADPTAGNFDAGYLHTLVFGIIVFCMASWVAWSLMRLNFPALYRYFDDKAEYDAINHRYSTALFAFAVYFLYFFAYIIIIISTV